HHQELEDRERAVLRELAAFFLVTTAGNAVVDAVANDLRFRGRPRGLVEHAVERDRGAGRLQGPDHVLALRLSRTGERDGPDHDPRRQSSWSHGSNLLGCDAVMALPAERRRTRASEVESERGPVRSAAGCCRRLSLANAVLMSASNIAPLTALD